MIEEPILLTPEVIEKTILGQDYSHPYTTSPDHVLQLYAKARMGLCEKICEIGSAMGISTVGLALAAKQNHGFVCSVDDCSLVSTEQRVKYWETISPPVMRHIFPYKAKAKDFLLNTEPSTYDFIFHDSEHGDNSIPELHLAWTKLTNKGILAVHDTEQLTSLDGLASDLKCNKYHSSKDNIGRELTFFFR